MAERWFLQVDGIDGESDVRGFERWIEAESFTWAATATVGAANRGGPRRGRTTLGNLFVTAPISVASPNLVAACVTGRIFPTVVLSAVRDGGTGRTADVFLSYELGDAIVVAVQHRDGPEGVPAEQLEFAYATVRITYTPRDNRGRAGQPVTTEHRIPTR